MKNFRKDILSPLAIPRAFGALCQEPGAKINTSFILPQWSLILVRSLGRPVTGELPGVCCVCIGRRREVPDLALYNCCCASILQQARRSPTVCSSRAQVRASSVTRLNLLSFQPIGHCQLRNSDLLWGQNPTPWHDTRGLLRGPPPSCSYAACSCPSLSLLSAVRTAPHLMLCQASAWLYLLFRLPAILLANCLLLCITSSRQSFRIPSLPLIALLLLDVSHIYLSWNFSCLVVTYWALTVLTGL